MNLIDKDAVVATIKKHVEEERHSYFCKCLLSEIDALKVKEQPDLPSNLDEAAEKYLKQYNESEFGNGGDDWDDDILITFKAGAEWMAGQFQKIEGNLVDWYSTSDGKDYCCGIKAYESFEVPEDFYIRKK